MKSIFEFSNYRRYLDERFGGKRTGQRLASSQAIGCHSTYMSQVMNERADLSLEQGEKLNRFFDHTQDEAHFFLLLLQKDRAGTPTLKKYFLEQIESVLQKRLVIKERIKKESHLSREDEAEFYSSWQYGAVRILLSIPELRTVEALTHYLKLSRSRIIEILDFLTKTNLAVLSDNEFKLGPTHIHLGGESKNINKHHTNWRMHAIASLDNKNQTDLHYSGTMTLSKADAEKIKEGFVSKLKNDLNLIEKSKEEVAYAYCFDFYNLKPQ
ncbi:MAG: TIGR02147 family protein [Pseudomonadota bacterium]|nr:TIGR02147 family protein [Pseudomonadota bacterium]